MALGRSESLVSEVLYGREVPRIWTRPKRELTEETSLGFECIRFASEVLGIELFPWQKWLLIHALELNPDGTFRFRKVVVLVARQQGKTTLFKVWALWRLFVDGAEAVLGTAHDLSTAERTWEEAHSMASGIPELKAEMGRQSHTNGNKFFRLKSGGEYLVRAATGGGGRGASIELVFMDELREHKNYLSYSAVSKTTNAIPRAQVVMMSNAGDDSSVVLNQLQDKGRNDIDMGRDLETATGLFEWSATPDCDIWDRGEWAQANPSLGHGTITEDIIAADCEADPEDVFRTEVLCQRVKTLTPSIFPDGAWPACGLRDDAETGRAHGVVFEPGRLDVAVEVSYNRETAYVVAAGMGTHGLPLVEVVAQRAGTAWVVPWLVERSGAFGRVVVQARGAPASSLIDPLLAASREHMERGDTDVPLWEVVEWGGPDLAKSHGAFYDAIKDGSVSHLSQPVLDAAAEGARLKPLGEAWVFDRAKSPVDVAPLTGAVSALWCHSREQEPASESAYGDDIEFAESGDDDEEDHGLMML